jgi:tetratricopeptide (TPR) repeat protein
MLLLAGWASHEAVELTEVGNPPTFEGWANAAGIAVGAFVASPDRVLDRERYVALRFGKKKPEEASLPMSAGTADIGKEAPPFEPQPEKARQWFEQAKSMADRYNHEAALFYYANGIRLDPKLRSAHEAMYEAGMEYCRRGGKSASGKELRDLSGPHPVDRFAAAEFAWLKDIHSASLALKFLESTVRAFEWAAEIGRWHAPRVLNILRRQKKTSKSSFLAAKDLLAQLGAWDEAIAAADDALSLDPNDAQLQNELKDLSAQRAMDQGRYEDAAGEEGGFQKFVVDMERQRELEEAQDISGGLDLRQRNLERARKEYEQSPGVPDVINQYGQLLKTLGTPESQQQAYEIFMKGYEDTGQYRFRATAGDIRIDEAQDRAGALREKLEQEGGNTQFRAQYEQARKEVLDLQYSELGERIKEYPTDRRLKHRLGETQFELGRFDEAMQCFQEAKDDPNLRVRAGYMLGRCFAAESWHDIAIQEYKEALERTEPGDRETELAVRYDLMVSLMEHARGEKSLELARESLEICSSIARKDITYRDIRACRKQVDELIKELSGPSSDA